LAKNDGNECWVYRPVDHHLRCAFHIQPVGIAVCVVSSSAVWRLWSRYDSPHVFTVRVERVEFTEAGLGSGASDVLIVVTKTRQYMRQQSAFRLVTNVAVTPRLLHNRLHIHIRYLIYIVCL